MKEYQIPNLKTAAYVGAAWLIALALATWFSIPTADSSSVVLLRILVGLLCAGGAALLVLAGRGYTAEADERTAAKEAVRRLEGAHRVA